MTPVTPASKAKGGTQPSGSKDESQHVDQLDLAQGEQQEDENDDYQDEADDANDDDYGTPSSKKRKAKGGRRGKAKGERAPASGWTEGEVLALFRASLRIALQHIRDVKSEPGLEKRTPQNVNLKMRSEFKKLDKTLGGDGKWVDDFRLAPGGSKTSSS